jgi:large repetitive protein
VSVAVSSSIGDELVALGIAIGLLKHDDGGGAVLNPDFFQDPAGHLGGILGDPVQRAAVLDLAGEVIGDFELELDLPDVPEGQTWLPIATTESPVSGVYVVLEERDDATLISLGGRIAPESDDLEAAATVLVPLVRVGEGGSGGGPDFLIGTEDGDIRLAATVTLPAGISSGPSAVELSGAALEVAISTVLDAPAARLTLQLRGLRLPGETAARDVLISEGEQLAAEALKIGVGLIESAAGETDFSDELGHLLAMAGLHAAPPIPELPVEELFTRGTAAFGDWLFAVFGDAASAVQWLDELGGFLGASGPAQQDPSDPTVFRLPVTSADPFVTILVRLALDPSSGTVVVAPGIELRIDPTAVAGLDGELTARAELFALTLGPTPAFAPLPALKLTAQIGSAAVPLVPPDDPNNPTFAAEAVRLGLSLDASHRPAAVLEALNVNMAGTEYPRLDLSSVDALMETASNALSGLLAKLLEALGASREAQALLRLAGFEHPEGAPAQGWPALVKLTDLFARPLEAIAAYHEAVAGTEIEVEGETRSGWQLLAAELAALLKAVPGVELRGSGTESDPWLATLFDNGDTGDDVRGSVALACWLTQPLTLHAGVRVAAEPIPLDGWWVQPAYVMEAVRLRIQTGEVAWAPSHRLEIGLGEDLELEVGPIELRARRLTANVGWTADTGLGGGLAVEGPALGIDGELIELPAIELRFDALEPPGIEEWPWSAIERLFAARLAARAEWGAWLGELLGWFGDVTLPSLRLPGLPELRLTAPQGSWPRLSLGRLAHDPWGALGAWLLGFLPQADGDPDLTALGLGRLATLLSPPASISGDVAPALSGSGRPDDPWALSAGAGGAELLAWLEPEGPALGGLADHAGHLLPAELTEPLESGGAPPATARLVELLRRASTVAPSLRDALGPRADLAAALDALRQRLGDGDGLVPVASQKAAGFADVSLGAVAHLDQPAAVSHAADLAGAPPLARCIFVSAALNGVSAWADQTEARTVDLTAPGLAPAALDLSAISGPGPWFLELPTRSAAVVPGSTQDDGLSEVLGRLRAAVVKARAEAGGQTVALIAHSTAGIPARMLASEQQAGISHLFTVGTPHAGATFDFFDDPLVGEAIRLLQRLGAELPAEAPAAELQPLLDLLDTIGAALDDYAAPAPGEPVIHSPFPTRDFTAPAFAPQAQGVTATALTSSVPAATFHDALAHLTLALLSELTESAAAAPTHAGFGVRARVASGGTETGELAVDAAVRLDLVRVALADGAVEAEPRMSAHAELRRVGRWLVGGPTGVHPEGTPRDPRLRWAELAVEAGTGPLEAAARVTLHDAAVFGRHEPYWVIDGSALAPGGEELAPEARVLLGELARAAGPLPTAGASRGLARLLEALRLVTIGTDGPLTLPSDPIERFLADPLTELRARLAPNSPDRAAVLARLAELAGGTAGPEPPGSVELPLGAGLALVLTPPPGASLALRASGAGLVIGGLTVTGSVSAGADGGLTGDLRLTPVLEPGPGRVHSVHLLVDSRAEPRVRATVDRGPRDGAPAPVATLLPDPDPGPLAEVAAQLIGSELLRMIIEWGLGEEGLPLRDPLGLLLDPAGWLGHPLGLGGSDGSGPLGLAPGAITSIVDAARPLLGLRGESGTLELPWGIELAITERGSELGVSIQTPEGAPLVAGAAKIGGALGLTFGPGALPEPEIAASLLLDDLPPVVADFDPLDRVQLDAGYADASITASFTLVPTGGQPIVIPLVPGVGLGALADLAATAATEQVLPLVLDELASTDALSPYAGDLADALGLRSNGKFAYAELADFGRDPVGELVPRLRANIDDAFEALDGLMQLVLADDAIEAQGDTLFLRPLDALEVSLTVPETGPLLVCAAADGIEPIEGLSVSARACANETGLTSLRLGAEVTGDALLKVSESVSFFPFLEVLLGAAATGSDRLEAGLWLSDPTDPDRHALAVLLPFGGSPPGVVCRVEGGPDSTDVTACAVEAVRTILAPLLLDQLLAIQEVEDRLDQDIFGGATLGQMLVGAKLLAQTASGYALADGALDPDKLGERALALGAQAVKVLDDAGWTEVEIGGVVIGVLVEQRTERTLFGVHIGLTPEGIELLAASGVKLTLEADAKWLGEGVVAGVDLLVLGVPPGAFDPAKIELRPVLRVSGVGLRAAGDPGPKLIEGAASVGSVALHGVFEAELGGENGGVARAGGHVVLDRLTLPLGRASGADNPVAAKLLSQGSNGSGSTTELAPAVSPALVLLSEPPDPLRVRLSFDGDEDGPWWFPVGQKFGPIYVEQVGLDTSEQDGSIETVTVLLDGGVSLMGLSVGLDDLSVAVPFKAPWDVARWRLGMAGLGVGYTGAGASLAGGLRKRSGTPPDYAGLILARFGEYGLTAIGGYAEYPTGEGDTYTSLFLFAALTAPLGGPPPFFVTGIGAGAGLNRKLILPPAVEDVATFPLVAAMDPQSVFATQPMLALDTLGSTFPPERGALWFAAGVRFTSFALVNSIAVLSVSIGEHLEIALLGLSRMALPRPEAPVANLELALRARFSTRDAVLSVEAQLTQNSWLISQSCRLTGGFAFVIWFRTGQFVLTLGGYHPAFAKPAEFPLVPRLGFNWAVSNEIVVKGEAYFALTATCVMAGGRLEASYRSGAIWAAFIMGMDVLVSWEPLHYDFHAYVSVSAGFRIEICIPFIGCARKDIGITLGADVHVWGPELRGEATIDVTVAKITVRFGSSGPEAGPEPIGFPEFRDKFLVAGDKTGLTMSATVLDGMLAAEAAPGSAAAEATGEAGKPWRVGPEFTLSTRTRAASTLVQSGAHSKSLTDITAQPIGIGPMRRAEVASRHVVALVRKRDGADVTGGLGFTGVEGNVPEGVWRVLGDQPVPEAKVRPALVGASLAARVTLPDEDVRASVERFDPAPVRPLPFHQERTERDRAEFQAIVQGAQAYIAAQPAESVQIFQAAAAKLADGELASPRTAYSALMLSADRVAAPMLAPLGEGMVSPQPAPADVSEQPAEPLPPQEDTSVKPPRLTSVLRGSAPRETAPPLVTTAPASADGVPRVPVPTIAAAERATRGAGAGRLELFDPDPRRENGTVLPSDSGPPTSRAGGLREVRNSLRVLPEDAAAVRALEAVLHAGDPISVTAGDVQVWQLPNAELDRDEVRPQLRVQGDQTTWAVVLDRAGAVLADRSGTDYELKLPQRAATLVVAGTGAPLVDADLAVAGLAGWHAGTTLAQVAADTYLGAASVVRTTSPDSLRGGRAAVSGMVRASDAVRGHGVVTTRFRGPAATLGVALETALSGDELMNGLVLGLEGAERARSGEEPAPPLIVVSGPRAYVLFALQGVSPDEPFAATVASDDRWTLGGCFAAASDADTVAARLANGGLDGLIAGLVASPLGASTATWIHERPGEAAA